MKSLVQLQSEIQTLQQQATELRSREFDRTVAEIVEQMAAFGITLAHLKAAQQKAPAKAARGRKPKGRRGRPKGSTNAKGASKAKRKAAAKRADKRAAKGAKAPKTGTRKPAAIKFRGPNGEAWSGRGKTPTWLKAQLEVGKTAADFRV